MTSVPYRKDLVSRLARAERAIEGLQRGPSKITLQRLIDESIAAALATQPVVTGDTVQTAGWQATNGGTIASLSIPWPAGKSSVVVMAQMTGFYFSEFSVPQSDRPAFRIVINGTQSPAQPRVPDNMDTYHLVGAFNREFNGSGSLNVSVTTTTGPTLAPAQPDNRIYLGAMAVFT